jgi:molecular chaperone DnaK (HSP70)
VSYALDFGTTNTVIARWNPLSQQAETVTLGNLSQTLTPGTALMPSVIYVENAAQNQVIVGQPVLDRGLDKSARFFQNFKRGVGAPIQGFLPELDGVPLSFERLGEWFLGEILRRLEEQEGQKLEQLILTVPVDSFETYRLWLSQICQDWAGEVYLLDEPTAAALGYGRPDANLVLVLDIGGGTADFSLVRLNSSKSAPTRGFLLKGWGQKTTTKANPQTQVIAKAGTALGGSDIDYWLQNYFCQTLNLQPSTWILRLAERLKIALSSQETATEVYFDDQALETYEFSLTRLQLEDILVKNGWFERLEGLLNQVRQQALGQGIAFEQIDAVLLVGGASQTPSFQTLGGTLFRPGPNLRRPSPQRRSPGRLANSPGAPGSGLPLPQLRRPLLEPPQKLPQLAPHYQRRSNLSHEPTGGTHPRRFFAQSTQHRTDYRGIGRQRRRR